MTGLADKKQASRTAPRPAKRRLTRDEKSVETRRALLEAAAKVVGRYGYEGASIARITARAHVAQGTFYNYFESRQDILDQVLPAMGSRMLDYLRTHVDPTATGWLREESRLRAYLEFLVENPWFHRLVNEAETLAPKAHHAYFGEVSQGYIRSLKRSIERGEIHDFSEQELEPLVYILMSIRTYLAQRYAYTGSTVRPVDQRIFDVYGKFVRHALFAE